MSTYISQSACAGARPTHLVSLSLISRPAHVSRLLRERHVPRFLVAPAGSGKTSLALDYAETVFALRNVYWLDGKSPCFLRDVDSGAIESRLSSVAARPFLMVVDDVPVLDPDRVDLFAKVIDAVVDVGGEVLVTCSPDADAFGRQTDRVMLDASDLLLSDEEFLALAPAAQLALEQAPRGARRVAGIVWGSKARMVAQLERLADEVTDPREKLALMVMLLLEKGGLDEGESALSAEEGLTERLRERYPLLGIEEDPESFETAPFEAAEIHRAFRGHLAQLAYCSEGRTIEGVVERVADRLMGEGRCERACGVVQAFLPKEHRAEWLARSSAELLDEGCLLAASDLFDSLPKSVKGARKDLLVDQEVRRAYLEFPAKGADELPGPQRTCRPSSDAIARLLVQVARYGGRWAPEALGLAGELLEAPDQDVLGSRSLCQRRNLRWAQRVLAAASEGCELAAREWLAIRCQSVPRSVLLLLGAWVLETACEFEDGCPTLPWERSQGPSAKPGAYDEFALGLAKLLGEDGGSAPFPESMACQALRSASERGLTLVAAPPAVAQSSHGVQVRLLDQRRDALPARSRGREGRRTAERNGYGARAPRPAHTPALPSKPWAPVLTVNLFGGLDVRIGDRRVAPDRFTRQKTKTLLALLVLNRGHELTRDKLVELLWPDSPTESGRRNLYCNWSALKKALSLEDGSCPYLVRQQQALSMDASLLSTDIELFNEVCDTLLFEKPGYGGWAQLHGQIDTAFAGDLLPSEEGNLVILRLRDQYRDRLVDALVCAANRLMESGSVTEALWFGRMAVSRDASREDAYVALMRAQIAAGQRKPAMDTYFLCRRYLADNLGINPSLETINLYNSVILSEEAYPF